MTHQAQIYINEKLFPGNPSSSYIEGYSLSQTEVTSLSKCLKNDAESYIYSSIVSAGDATLGINEKLLTWATVKLYYATFYALRSLLAMDGVCIFYIKTSSTKATPFIVTVKPAQMAKKGKGTTHKLVLDAFKQHKIEPRLLSQPIALQEPLEWLVEKREEANYKNARFSEPQVPKHFEKIISSGLRRVIQEYLRDSSDLYLFDPDHAILAYPLRAIKLAYNKLLNSGNVAFTDDEISYLCQLFKDKNGQIPEIYNLLKNP